MPSFQPTEVTSELTIDQAVESSRQVRPRGKWNHPLKPRVVGEDSTPCEWFADFIEYRPYSFKCRRQRLKRIHAIAELETGHAGSLDAKWALPVLVTFRSSRRAQGHDELLPGCVTKHQAPLANNPANCRLSDTHEGPRQHLVCWPRHLFTPADAPRCGNLRLSLAEV
jgi:hypothetical protein